jgi:hypothetical protein
VKTQMSISDLLAHRDGERLEPEVSAQIEADPQARSELATLRRIKHELNALAPIEPDPSIWAEINQAQAPQRNWTLRYPLATAATVFLAAALAIVTWNPASEFAGDAAPPAVVLPDGGLADLMSRSRSLQAELPVRGLQAGQFRSSSSEQALLYRIADVDAELIALYEAPQMDVEHRERLWSQRVELLESLTDVQRGQAVLRPAIY